MQIEPYNRNRDREFTRRQPITDFEEGIIDDIELKRRRVHGTLDENNEAENIQWALSQIERHRDHLRDAQSETGSMTDYLNQLPGMDYKVSVLYVQEPCGGFEDERSIWAVKVIDLRFDDIDQFHIDLLGIYMENDAALKAAEKWNENK